MASLSLIELAHDPARVHEATPEDAARLLAELSTLALTLAARLAFQGSQPSAKHETDRAAPGPSDRWLTVAQVAERFGRDGRWVYRRAHNWPFTVKEGKCLSFSERGLERWMERHRVNDGA